MMIDYYSRKVGVRHWYEGHLQEGQGGDPGVLQEGVPRERHHQHRGEQPLHQDQQLVQARPEEVSQQHSAVGETLQMSWWVLASISWNQIIVLLVTGAWKCTVCRFLTRINDSEMEVECRKKVEHQQKVLDMKKVSNIQHRASDTNTQNIEKTRNLDRNIPPDPDCFLRDYLLSVNSNFSAFQTRNILCKNLWKE